MKLSYYWILLYLMTNLTLSAQEPKTKKFTISGYLEDAETGEKLIGANVFEPKSGLGSTSNVYGFYSLTVPEDSVYLAVSYIGMKTKYYSFYLDKDLELDIKLSSNIDLQEVEVVASETEENLEEQVQMSQISIPIKQIKALPAFMGEVDVLKALQLLPGVQSGNEGTSGLYVRGGGPDQNLILLDGVPVYNAYHLFGFFSVFNADAIKGVTLTKGGHPARYGGRLSSILEINMKEGNTQKFHGEGAVGLIASKFTLEGPIWKDKTSFIISGRRTYIDLLTKPILAAAKAKQIPSYYFYDVTAKINHKFNRQHRLYLSFYAGDDKFNMTFKDGNPNGTWNSKNSNSIQWGNITSALRWNYLISDQLFSNTTLTYSRYNLNIDITNEEEFTQNDSIITNSFSARYFSGIEDISAKVDFEFIPLPTHYIRFGANYTYHTFKPGALNTKNESGLNNPINQNFANDNIKASEFYLYAEDDWRIGKIFRVNLGVHASGFGVRNKLHYSVQPRVGMRFMLPHNIGLKASFSTMTQYLHLLSNEGAGLPTDLWLPSTDIIKPQQAWQVGLGLSKTFGDWFEVSLEGYYKKMSNLIAYKPGASFIETGNDWESKIESNGIGQSYGMEAFIHKKKGRFTGWVGYTLSWSWRHFPNTTINSGKPYPFKYDRRHDISVAAMYKFSEKISASAVWVFGTGNAVTLPVERYIYPSQGGYIREIETFDSKNNYRMKPYHRLDLSIDFHKKLKNWEYTFSIGTYNTYSRKNPFFIFSGQNIDTGKREFKQANLFPIIPFFRWSFKF